MQQSPEGMEPATSTARSQTLSWEFLLSKVSVPKKERRLPCRKCHASCFRTFKLVTPFLRHNYPHPSEFRTFSS